MKGALAQGPRTGGGLRKPKGDGRTDPIPHDAQGRRMYQRPQAPQTTPLQPMRELSPEAKSQIMAGAGRFGGDIPNMQGAMRPPMQQQAPAAQQQMPPLMQGMSPSNYYNSGSQQPIFQAPVPQAMQPEFGNFMQGVHPNAVPMSAYPMWQQNLMTQQALNRMKG